MYAQVVVELFFLLFILVAIVYAAYLLVGAYSSAPYVATSKEVRRIMLKLAGTLDGTRVLELGSGDGSLCLDAAACGATAYGIEIHPMLVLLSRWRANRLGLSDRVTFVRGNFWKMRLPPSDVVLVYMLPEVMSKISKLLRDQLPSGTVVISHGFRFSDLLFEVQEGEALRYRLP